MKMTNEQKRLAEMNVDLVDIIIRSQVKFSQNSYSMLYEEMRSVGFMALCDAAIHFDPAKDVKFRTYANRVVLNAILNEVKEHYNNEAHIFRIKFDDEEDRSMDHLSANDDDSVNDFYRFENQELLQRLIRSTRKSVSKKVALQPKKALDILELIIQGIEVKDIAKAMHTSTKRAVEEQIRKKFTDSTHQLTFTDLAAFGCVTFSL